MTKAKRKSLDSLQAMTAMKQVIKKTSPKPSLAMAARKSLSDKLKLSSMGNSKKSSSNRTMTMPKKERILVDDTANRDSDSELKNSDVEQKDPVNTVPETQPQNMPQPESPIFKKPAPKKTTKRDPLEGLPSYQGFTSKIDEDFTQNGPDDNSESLISSKKKKKKRRRSSKEGPKLGSLVLGDDEKIPMSDEESWPSGEITELSGIFLETPHLDDSPVFKEKETFPDKKKRPCCKLNSEISQVQETQLDPHFLTTPTLRTKKTPKKVGDDDTSPSKSDEVAYHTYVTDNSVLGESFLVTPSLNNDYLHSEKHKRRTERKVKRKKWKGMEVVSEIASRTSTLDTQFLRTPDISLRAAKSSPLVKDSTPFSPSSLSSCGKKNHRKRDKRKHRTKSGSFSDSHGDRSETDYLVIAETEMEEIDGRSKEKPSASPKESAEKVSSPNKTETENSDEGNSSQTSSTFQSSYVHWVAKWDKKCSGSNWDKSDTSDLEAKSQPWWNYKMVGSQEYEKAVEKGSRSPERTRWTITPSKSESAKKKGRVQVKSEPESPKKKIPPKSPAVVMMTSDDELSTIQPAETDDPHEEQNVNTGKTAILSRSKMPSSTTKENAAIRKRVQNVVDFFASPELDTLKKDNASNSAEKESDNEECSTIQVVVNGSQDLEPVDISSKEVDLSSPRTRRRIERIRRISGSSASRKSPIPFESPAMGILRKKAQELVNSQNEKSRNDGENPAMAVLRKEAQKIVNSQDHESLDGSDSDDIVNSTPDRSRLKTQDKIKEKSAVAEADEKENSSMDSSNTSVTPESASKRTPRKRSSNSTSVLGLREKASTQLIPRSRTISESRHVPASPDDCMILRRGTPRTDDCTVIRRRAPSGRGPLDRLRQAGLEVNVLGSRLRSHPKSQLDAQEKRNAKILNDEDIMLNRDDLQENAGSNKEGDGLVEESQQSPSPRRRSKSTEEKEFLSPKFSKTASSESQKSTKTRRCDKVRNLMADFQRSDMDDFQAEKRRTRTTSTSSQKSNKERTNRTSMSKKYLCGDEDEKSAETVKSPVVDNQSAALNDEKLESDLREYPEMERGSSKAENTAPRNRRRTRSGCSEKYRIENGRENGQENGASPAKDHKETKDSVDDDDDSSSELSGVPLERKKTASEISGRSEQDSESNASRIEVSCLPRRLKTPTPKKVADDHDDSDVYSSDVQDCSDADPHYQPSPKKKKRLKKLHREAAGNSSGNDTTSSDEELTPVKRKRATPRKKSKSISENCAEQPNETAEFLKQCLEEMAPPESVNREAEKQDDLSRDAVDPTTPLTNGNADSGKQKLPEPPEAEQIPEQPKKQLISEHPKKRQTPKESKKQQPSEHPVNAAKRTKSQAVSQPDTPKSYLRNRRDSSSSELDSDSSGDIPPPKLPRRSLLKKASIEELASSLYELRSSDEDFQEPTKLPNGNSSIRFGEANGISAADSGRSTRPSRPSLKTKANKAVEPENSETVAMNEEADRGNAPDDSTEKVTTPNSTTGSKTKSPLENSSKSLKTAKRTQEPKCKLRQKTILDCMDAELRNVPSGDGHFGRDSPESPDFVTPRQSPEPSASGMGIDEVSNLTSSTMFPNPQPSTSGTQINSSKSKKSSARKRKRDSVDSVRDLVADDDEVADILRNVGKSIKNSEPRKKKAKSSEEIAVHPRSMSPYTTTIESPKMRKKSPNQLQKKKTKGMRSNSTVIAESPDIQPLEKSTTKLKKKKSKKTYVFEPTEPNTSPPPSETDQPDLVPTEAEIGSPVTRSRSRSRSLSPEVPRESVKSSLRIPDFPDQDDFVGTTKSKVSKTKKKKEREDVAKTASGRRIPTSVQKSLKDTISEKVGASSADEKKTSQPKIPASEHDDVEHDFEPMDTMETSPAKSPEPKTPPSPNMSMKVPIRLPEPVKRRKGITKIFDDLLRVKNEHLTEQKHGANAYEKAMRAKPHLGMRNMSVFSKNPLRGAEPEKSVGKRGVEDQARLLPDQNDSKSTDRTIPKRFSPGEDLILKRNWENFCNQVENVLDNPEELIMRPARPKSEEMLLINHYDLYDMLRIGLNNRTKFQCYERLKRILENEKCGKKGSMDQDEVKQLKELIEKHGNDWVTIGKVMDRSRRSIKDLARKCHDRAQKNTKGSRWSKDEDDELLRSIRNATMVDDLKTLTDEDLKKVDWVVVAENHNSRHRDSCWSRWHDHLFYEVHGIKRRMPNYDETEFLFEQLQNLDVEYFSQIPWNELAKDYPREVVGFSLKRKMIHLRRSVENFASMDWGSCLKEIVEKYKRPSKGPGAGRQQKKK